MKKIILPHLERVLLFLVVVFASGVICEVSLFGKNGALQSDSRDAAIHRTHWKGILIRPWESLVLNWSCLCFKCQMYTVESPAPPHVCPQGQPLHLIQGSDLKLGEVSRAKQRFVAVEYKYSPLCRKHFRCLPLEAPVSESPLLEGFGC